MYLGKDLNGNRYAIKYFFENKLNTDESIQKMIQHQEKLKQLDHPKIVKIYDLTSEAAKRNKD